MLKALKENLALLSMVVVLAGTSSTDTYYSTFGLRYQSLALPAPHILFRGLTAVWGFPPLGLAYLVVFGIMTGQSRAALLLGGLERVRWLNYAATALIAVAAWFGGGRAGYVAALGDMSAASSTLPLLVRIDLKGATPGAEHIPTSPSEGYRLLLQGSEGIRFFKTSDHPETQSPLVHFLPMGGVDEITTCPNC